MSKNVTNNTKTYTYSLTVSGIDVPCYITREDIRNDKPAYFNFDAYATHKQYINAVALIEKIIGDVEPYLFMLSDDIEWEGEYYGFDERFSRKYRHDITKDDLMRLLVEIQNVILTFKHEDKKGE